MSDLKNFRSSYLEKVGIKGVEEKKSLELLLKDQPLDLSKLSQFCIRFAIPARFRIQVWKILLGVLPKHHDAHDYVYQQRKEQYQETIENLQIMKKIDCNTWLPDVHLKMFLIEENRFNYDESKMLLNKENQIFYKISQSMVEIADDPVDAYWLSTSFYRKQYLQRDTLNGMVKCVEEYVLKEDSEGSFHKHLIDLKSFSSIPFIHWFEVCFADALPENALERLWDKIIAGSVKILLFIAVALIFTFKRSIMSTKSKEELLKCFEKIPADSGDIIAGKAIDLWKKYAKES